MTKKRGLHLKTGFSQIAEAWDGNTGELLSQTTKVHKYIAGSSEEFFMIYSSMIAAFMDMTQAQIRVFGYLLRYATGTRFAVTKAVRIDIQAHTGINERTAYNTLSQLEEMKLIYKAEGLYQVNPRFAFKGSTTTRKDALKTIIELGCTDC